MERIISCMDSFELLSTLSFTARVGFARGEGWMQMTLFFSAFALCLWGFVLAWWKYTQSVFVLSSCPFFSFKYKATRNQISRVPATLFALDRVCHANNRCIDYKASTVYCEARCINTQTSGPAEKNESEGGGKIYMRFECSLQGPEELPVDEFVQNRGASVADCKNYITSFSSSSEKQRLNLGNFRNYIVQDNYEEVGLASPKRDLLKLLLLPEDIVKCVDISWSRELLATSTLDGINTVRLWDIPASRCLNYRKFDDTPIFAGTRFSNSSHLHLLSGVVIAEEKSWLYVWDTRNFVKPLSFSLGKMSTFDIVEFDDKKVYVCDDLSERVFDLRMCGAPVLQLYPRVQRKDRLTPSCFMDEESAPQLGNCCNLQDFGLYTSSLLH